MFCYCILLLFDYFGLFVFFFFKQKTAYEMRISDWSSDVCSSDLPAHVTRQLIGIARPDYAPVYAEALEQLGTEAALVVSGEEGLDEVSGAGPTIAVSVGSLAMPPSIAPEDAGLPRQDRKRAV